MIAALRSLLRFRPTPPPDAAVIDQGAYFDSLRHRQRQSDEAEEIVDRSQNRVAAIVLTWSTHTVSDRRKHPLPTKLRGVILQWLDGLSVREIFALSTSDVFTIRQHIFGGDGETIYGVREVQALPPAVLHFPPPKIVQDDGRPGAGGGPRRL